MTEENTEFVLTQEAFEKYRAELDYLKSTKREEMAERLKEAIALGDLSENSEYDDAKEEQGHVEAKIKELEYMLRRARIIEKSEIKTDEVSLGSTVRFVELNSGRELEMMIVDKMEADLKKKKMSKDSPIGVALMGHKVGEVIEVVVPKGIQKCKILSVNLD